MHRTHSGTLDSTWQPLYRIGGIAALLAAVIFRRNIGAEVSLFTGAEAIPQSVVDWYTLLQDSPFVSLAFLAVFDIVNYALVGLIFLALGAMFWQNRRRLVAMALAGGLVGIAVSFASNISLSMLSLSQQYAAASSRSAEIRFGGRRTGYPGNQRSFGDISRHWRVYQFAAHCPGRLVVFGSHVTFQPCDRHCGLAGERMRSDVLSDLCLRPFPASRLVSRRRFVLDDLASADCL